MNAWVSYARASTEEQSASCAQQHIENVRKAGAPYAATFDDDGVPGRIAVDSRPGLKRLCDFLRSTPKGTFDVRCYDTSRLGRFDDPEYHFVAEWLLKEAGARRVVFTKGAFTEGRSIANSVLKIVEAHQNRAYSEKLSRDVHRGLIAAVRDGKRSGGFAPYGYDLEYPDQNGKPYARVRFIPVGGRRAFEKHVTYLDDGRVRIIDADNTFRPETKSRRSRLVAGDPKRIEAVRMIFDLYSRGRGYRTIAHELDAKGFISPEASGWSITAVRSILMNPVYTGRAVYGRRSESKYHRLEQGGVVRELAEGESAQKHQMHVKDESRWVSVEGAHEALITDEVWRAANERREKRVYARPIFKGRRPYMLSGMLKCPKCERNYGGARSKSGHGGGVTPYYVCSSYQRGIGCSRGGVREDELDQKVLELLAEGLMSKATDTQFRAAVTKTYGALFGAQAPTETSSATPDTREADLAAVEAEIDKIVKSVSPENLQFFDAKLTELRRERDRLKAAAAPKRRQVAARTTPAEELEAAITTSLAVRRQFALATKGRDEPDVLKLRDELLPLMIRQARAYPELGYVEVEGYAPKEAVTTGRPLMLWRSCNLIGRSGWRVSEWPARRQPPRKPCAAWAGWRAA